MRYVLAAFICTAPFLANAHEVYYEHRESPRYEHYEHSDHYGRYEHHSYPEWFYHGRAWCRYHRC